MATTYYMSAISMIVQYLTNLGLVAAGGQVFTYVAGTPGTPTTTWTDSTGIVPNPNPMTLSPAGRPQSASGAEVAFWVPGGVSVGLQVLDAAGNQLVFIDNIPALNDPTSQTNSLAQQLDNPQSANSTGVGPVAGADLVANAVKSYDVFADVRVANVPTLLSGQTLNIEVQGGSTVNDGIGGTFFWSPTSLVNDDGITVLKPNGVANANPGRYLRNYIRGVPLAILKPTDQQVVSSTALVNDTALSLTLQSGTYHIQERLQFLGSGGSGQGYKAQLTFGGTVTSNNAGVGVASANSAPAAVYASIGTAVTGATLSNAGGDACNLDYIVTVTAGTLTVQFAQNSASANPTILKAGSALMATRLG